MKAREVKRAKLVARYAEKRAALKKIIATADVNTEEGKSYLENLLRHGHLGPTPSYSLSKG